VQAEIQRRFEGNLSRVQHLIDVHARVAPADGATDDTNADLLRAAVVFMHATLEDLLRSVLEWRLPAAPPGHLRDVPLVGKPARSTLTLEDLAGHRGSTVDELITRSVVAHLDRSNFNNPGEIEKALLSVGLDRGLLAPHKYMLGPMMNRRHWIVHRTDRPTAARGEPFDPAPLDRRDIHSWLQPLTAFGRAVIAALQPLGA